MIDGTIASSRTKAKYGIANMAGRVETIIINLWFLTFQSAMTF